MPVLASFRNLTVVVSIAAVAGMVGMRVMSHQPQQAAPAPRSTVLQSSSETVRAELVPPETSGLFALPMRISGRVANGPEPGDMKHQWPGFHAEARFLGETVTVRFDDDINRLRVTLDSGVMIEVARPGVADLRISGLTPGSHGIRLEKLSESGSPALFGGFLVDTERHVLSPPEPARKQIEFIGDSDTVGYGNASETRECSDEQLFEATDTSQAFGPKVAAHFGADYRLVARSGIGLLPGADEADPQVAPGMSLLYDRALPDEAGSMSIPASAPDIVVVGLGSNDFETGYFRKLRYFRALRAGFEATLTEFVRERGKENPHAMFVLLAFGEYGDALVEAYRAAAEALRRDGFRTSLVVLPKLERTGCHWHPSLHDHAIIAERLIVAIEAVEPDR